MNDMPLLSALGISKSFPGVRALAGVDFILNAGEVHGLIGENGAGKSTLVKILAGVQGPDEGEIKIGDEHASLSSPLAAQRAGIACIFQELNVVRGLSIAENVVLGSEPRRVGFFDRRAARADPHVSGDVTVGGVPLQRNSTSAAIKAGLALVPEERRAQGIVPVLSVFENAGLVWDEFPGRRASSASKKSAIMDATRKLSVKTPSLWQRINKLSGGNQQKVVLSKWLLAQTKVMLLDEPTRGIDVGAKREIYRIIGELAEAGMAVVLVSSELPELLGLADRIAKHLISCGWPHGQSPFSSLRARHRIS